VSVKSPAAYLVPAGLGGQRIAETGQHRASQHDGAAQGGIALEELGSAEIIHIHCLRTETVASLSQLLHLDTHILQQGNQVVDIQDVGDIADCDFLPGQQHRAQYLEHLVLGSLRIYLS